MTEALNIKINKTGFPVNVGEVELWFDSSLENLKTFINIEKLAEEKLNEVRKKAKHVHFPDDVSTENVDEVSEDDIESAFSATKEFIAIQYDLMFGDGAFKKIYEVHPDIIALEAALEAVGEGIAAKLKESEAKRAQGVEAKQKEYIKKKLQKQKQK